MCSGCGKPQLNEMCAPDNIPYLSKMRATLYHEKHRLGRCFSRHHFLFKLRSKLL
jgi:hypothetical protein